MRLVAASTRGRRRAALRRGHRARALHAEKGAAAPAHRRTPRASHSAAALGPLTPRRAPQRVLPVRVRPTQACRCERNFATVAKKCKTPRHAERGWDLQLVSWLPVPRAENIASHTVICLGAASNCLRTQSCLGGFRRDLDVVVPPYRPCVSQTAYPFGAKGPEPPKHSRLRRSVAVAASQCRGASRHWGVSPVRPRS